MSAETKNVVNIIKLLASGVIVVLIALGLALLFNSGIDFYMNNKLDTRLTNLSKTYSDSELAALREHNAKLNQMIAEYSTLRAEMEAEAAEIEEANKALMGGSAPKQSKSDGELTEKQKAYLAWQEEWNAYYANQAEYAEYLVNLAKYQELKAVYDELDKMLAQHEEYYNYYTANNHENTREQRDYHYYGQFYEMFMQMYKADTIFLGSSRTVYGINPLYLEGVDSLEYYSFYNFALNAAGPSYYLEWYNVFKNEAQYPLPDTVIYSVDWFMFDDSWMWRRTNYDTRSGGALYAIRSYMENAAANASYIEQMAALAEAGEDVTLSIPSESVNPDSSSGTNKKPKNAWEYLVALWNGDIRIGLADLANYFKDEVPLYANQDAIVDMTAYFFSGGSASDDAVVNAKKAELEAGLTAYKLELEAAFEAEKANQETIKAQIESRLNSAKTLYKSLTGKDWESDIPSDTDPGDTTVPDNTTPGDTTPGGTTPGDTIVPPDDQIPDISTLPKAPEHTVIPEIPELEFTDTFYENREFCVDNDGNVASEFYRGFIPWEAEYFGGKKDGSGDQYKNESVRQLKTSSYDREMASFVELINQMKADGINVVFIQLPDFSSARPNDTIWENTQLIAELAESLQVEFYNYNHHPYGDTSLDDNEYYHDVHITGSYVGDAKKYFSNWNHFNASGAKKFTQYLAKDLAAIINGEDLTHN